MAEKLSCYGEKPEESCKGCCWYNDCWTANFEEESFISDCEHYENDTYDDYNEVDIDLYDPELDQFQEYTGFVGNHDIEEKEALEMAADRWNKDHDDIITIAEPYALDPTSFCGVYHSQRGELGEFWKMFDHIKHSLGFQIRKYIKEQENA